jgi:hypothetical protein
VIACGLLLLLPAELPLIGRFGGTAAAIVGASLIGQTFLLPQLLAGPLGRWLRPDRQPAALTPMTVHPAEAIVPPAPHVAGVETPVSERGASTP